MVGTIIIAAPLTIAYLCDRTLSSIVHIPITGVTGVVVALCDAFFGQIVSYTQAIPFSPVYTPRIASGMIKKFDILHRQILVEWIVAKLASGTTVAVSAIIALLLKDGKTNPIMQGVCYITLGISLRSVVFFIKTYFDARKASMELRLMEMRRQYRIEHPPPPVDKEVLKKQRNTEEKRPVITLEPQ